MTNLRVRLALDEFARHRVQFEAFCRSLDAKELATPIPGSHWTVRDYIAHLCTIDSLIAAAWAPIYGVEAPPPVTPVNAPFDIDDWNDAAVGARRDATIDELLAEGGLYREAMAACIERMGDEDLDRIIDYGGDRKALNLPPSKVRFGGLLWGIAIHDPTHTRDILRALPHRAGEPAIAEWVASVSDALVPHGVREQRI